MSSQGQGLFFLMIAYQPNLPLQLSRRTNFPKASTDVRASYCSHLKKRPFPFLSQRTTTLNLLRKTHGGQIQYRRNAGMQQ